MTKKADRSLLSSTLTSLGPSIRNHFIRTHTCAYQEEGNVSFLEHFAYALVKLSRTVLIFR